MRQIVEARDVEVYFGKSIHASYKILGKIRTALGKKPRHPINIQEFDDFHNFTTNGIAKTLEENDALKKLKNDSSS